MLRNCDPQRERGDEKVYFTKQKEEQREKDKTKERNSSKKKPFTKAP